LLRPHDSQGDPQGNDQLPQCLVFADDTCESHYSGDELERFVPVRLRFLKSPSPASARRQPPLYGRVRGPVQTRIEVVPHLAHAGRTDEGDDFVGPSRVPACRGKVADYTRGDGGGTG
jgi:hypothetical protein